MRVRVRVRELRVAVEELEVPAGAGQRVRVLEEAHVVEVDAPVDAPPRDRDAGEG